MQCIRYGCTKWVTEKKSILYSSGRSIRGCLNRPDWIQTGKQPKGHFFPTRARKKGKWRGGSYRHLPVTGVRKRISDRRSGHRRWTRSVGRQASICHTLIVPSPFPWYLALHPLKTSNFVWFLPLLLLYFFLEMIIHS